MARYDHLPLWHAALKTAIAIERAVARFPRAHKYGLGADLRRQGQRVCALVVRANAARSERAQTVERLVGANPVGRGERSDARRGGDDGAGGDGEQTPLSDFAALSPTYQNRPYLNPPTVSSLSLFSSPTGSSQ